MQIKVQAADTYINSIYVECCKLVSEGNMSRRYCVTVDLISGKNVVCGVYDTRDQADSVLKEFTTAMQTGGMSYTFPQNIEVKTAETYTDDDLSYWGFSEDDIKKYREQHKSPNVNNVGTE